MTVEITDLSIPVGEHETSVSGLYLKPEEPKAVLALGHGAGAGMTHVFMEQLAAQLGEHGIATLRYNFPYKEHGGKRPDRTPVLTGTIKAVFEVARQLADGSPIFAGGKSMGGRMTSQTMAVEQFSDLKGLVFYGFPLHPAGKPGVARADHLADAHAPLLFLQGSRDRLADIGLIRGVVSDLGSFATLHVIEDADHSFNMLKRSGRSNADAIAELALETHR
ncbi:MAG: dienelactone hydrolase family protein, partial [Gammaproteobacteria bacterium]|nr:dienelactone hydrolase family protein [Gammaproteobacteria bacterium]